jgi:hypothetical protein
MIALVRRHAGLVVRKAVGVWIVSLGHVWSPARRHVGLLLEVMVVTIVLLLIQLSRRPSNDSRSRRFGQY